MPETDYQVFGTGGNINKIHKLFGKKHMKPLYLDELKELLNQLEPLSLKQRIKKYNLKQDRADVIVPALNIYSTVLYYLFDIIWFGKINKHFKGDDDT